MPIGGFTETVDLESVPPHIAVSRLQKLAHDVRETTAISMGVDEGRDFEHS